MHVQRILLAGLLWATLAAPAASEGGLVSRQPADTQTSVRARGYLRCGVSDLTPGDPIRLDDGGMIGFHTGFCRAVAVAVLGDADDVVYLPLAPNERFAALRSGEIDLLVGSVSVTLERDTAQPFAFGPVVFHDGRERFAPVVREGDDRWLDTVTWVVYTLIQAEEWGLTAALAESIAGRPPGSLPAPLERFVGFERGVVTRLDLDADALRRVVARVGNYGELYARHLGPDASTSLPRGPNRLYTEGGLLYAPPFSPR